MSHRESPIGAARPAQASSPNQRFAPTGPLDRLDLCNADFTALWEARLGSTVRAALAADSHYLILDTDLTIVVAGEAYLRAAEITPAEALGRPFFAVLPDSSHNPERTRERLHAVLAHLLRGGAVGARTRHRYDIRRPDGTFAARWWHVLNLPIAGADGRVCGILHSSYPGETTPPIPE